jgi:D-xylonolactonase
MINCTFMANAKYEIEALVNEHCECGENPLWDAERKQVFWTDIPNGWIFRFDPATNQHQKIYDGEVVGGFTFQEDGRLLLFGDRSLSLLETDGSARVLPCRIEAATGRFNDVMADPQGRVFAGTIGIESELCGGLFRLDLDGSFTPMWSGTGCSNGMGFTPDLKQMYWTDSTSCKIYRFDYDRVTGELENRREFYSAPAGAGIPDGMAVDSQGCVWSAHWDGFAIHRFDPQGALMESIKFPVGQISSVTFGGENLDELYVTSAGGSARKGEAKTADTPDGTLFRVRTGVKGQPEFRSRLDCAGA